MSERGAMNMRAVIAAGVFVAILVAAFLIARPRHTPGDDPVEPPPAPAPSVLPTAPKTLTRGDLIDAAARAADAAGRGATPPAENAALAGRRFSLRIAFGCDGADRAERADPLGWSYDADEGTLRAVVTPEVWTDLEIVRSVSSTAEVEAAEGFWISWPWLRVGECPRPPLPQPASRAASGSDAIEDAEKGQADVAPQPPRPPETLGVMELFAPGSPRAMRRNGKPYELTIKASPDEIDFQRGLRLIVQGRLAALADGQPLICRVERAVERPLCMINADVERIAVTDADGHVLAEWTD